MHGDRGAFSLIERAQPDVVRSDGTILDGETRVDMALADFAGDFADRIGTLLEWDSVFHLIESNGSGAGKNLVTPANPARSRHRA